MRQTGLLLILGGAVLLLVGALFLFSDRIPFLGRLPGDIHIQGKHSSFYFPITTCIVVSLMLTILVNLFIRIFRR